VDHTENEKIIIRYSPPTRYDNHTLGSVCKVLSDNNSYTYYIKIDETQDHSQWVTSGQLLEKIFDKYMEQPKFIDACLAFLKTDQETSALEKIIETLKSN